MVQNGFMGEHMNILENDLSEVKYKWDEGDYHSCEINDLGRNHVIWEIVVCCSIGKLSKDFTYYKILYEGELEGGCEDFEDVVDEFVRVQPTMKLVRVYEEVKC
mgnify:FL=1